MRATVQCSRVFPGRLPAALLTTVAALAGLIPLSVPGTAQEEDGGSVASTEVCPGSAPNAASLAGAVLGTIRGRPVRGAMVVLEGERIPRVAALTDSSGIYFFCQLPPDGNVRLEARFGQWIQGPVRLDIEPGLFHRQDFYVGPGTGQFVGKAGSAALGRIQGFVRDRTSGESVEGAVIQVVETGEDAVTDGDGRFVIPEVRPGERTVRIHHVGYGTTEHPLTVPEATSATMAIQLAPVAIDLDPIIVTGTRDRWLERHGFYERMETAGMAGAGTFITREEIEAQNPLELTAMLNSYPSVEIRCPSMKTRNDCVLRFTPTPCIQAVLYLDGVRARGFTIDELVNPFEVAGIELYRTPAELPAEFADPVSQRCGAVVIWTRAGP